MIERASDKPYADFMREEVFLPLGLTHTSVDLAPGLETHQAVRYTPEGKRIPFYAFDHPGASAVYSSAHDLVRFAMFHMKEHLADQRAILKDESIDAMQVPTAMGEGYGVGWGSFTNKRGYHCVQHTGGMPGVSTVCRLVPGQRLAVVVLANSRTGLPYYLADRITDVLLPERKEPAEKPKAEEKNASGGGPSRGGFVPSAELIGKWKGVLATHKGETPLTLEVKDSGDVHVRVDRQLVTLLNKPSFAGGMLRGEFAARVDYDDARGRDYNVRLELKLRDNVPNGSATTTTVPDQWGSSAVTHWVEVKKQ